MAEVVVGKADRGSSIQVGRGDAIIIRLDENPTTGYRWAIDHLDEAVLSAAGSDFTLGPGGGIGGGGERVFSFRARGPGTGRIELKLWRDWEGDASTVERFDLIANVSA